MVFGKISDFFISRQGKQVSFFVVGTVTSCVTVCNFLPQTILLNQYVDLFRLYKKGIKVSLPKKLSERFDKALEYAKIDPEIRPLFTPFAACGFEIFNAGTTYSRFGVAIGIPANFFYDTPDDVDKSSIKLNLEPVLWDTEEGQAFQKAIVMPEKAQLYAMSKEILMGSSAKFLLDNFYAFATCLMTYGIARRFNKTLNLYARPMPLRLFMYSLVSTFTIGNYILATDFTQIHYEQKIDKELKKNRILAEGGKEYYSRILARNIALRKLLGKDGEQLFTACGNENFFIRTKRTPLVDRKLFFEKEDVLEAV